MNAQGSAVLRAAEGGVECVRDAICTLWPPQKANKGQSRAIERLKKKMFENEFLLLLNSPTIPFRIHNRNGKVRKGW